MAAKDQKGVLTAHSQGLVFGCVLDGQGGGRVVDWDAVHKWKPDGDPIWVHLDRSAPETAEWLTEGSGLNPEIAKALLEQETRPRIFRSGQSLVAILRGVNLNAGADPDDMVALRIYVSKDRLITVRQRPLMTPRDMLRQLIENGGGACSTPELFVRLAERLTERMNSVVINLDEVLDDIEQQLDNKPGQELRGRLSEVRQTAVSLRRYIGPQREALSEIQIERPDWLGAPLSVLLRETSNKLQRYVEDLDAARDRAIVIRDEITNRQADAMNHRMYALSVIAGIFLPLSFLTGLLGINVGGMPGVESGWAFWITCLLLAVLVAFEIYIFRRLKWI
jgi:zinc transporter